MEFSALLFMYGHHGLAGLERLSERKIEQEPEEQVEQVEQVEQEQPESEDITGGSLMVNAYEQPRGRFIDKQYLHERKSPMVQKRDIEAEQMNAHSKANANIVKNNITTGLGFDFKRRVKMSKSELNKSFGKNNIDNLNPMMGGSLLDIANTKPTKDVNIRLIV